MNTEERDEGTGSAVLGAFLHPGKHLLPHHIRNLNVNSAVPNLLPPDTHYLCIHRL